MSLFILKFKKILCNIFIICIFDTLLIILPFLLDNSFADNAIHSPKIIRVGAYDNRPKIYLNESGKIEGLFPEVLNYIAKKEGWKLVYVHGTWNQCLQRLENNEIDIMVDVAFSEERAKKYIFSNESFLINWAEVYSNSEESINSLIDLNNKKIAVMKGSIHTDGENGIIKLVNQFGIDCNFVEVVNYKKVFELISNNEVDAGVVNRIFGSLFSKSYNVKKTSVIFNPIHIKFAFPKSSPLASGLIKRIDQNLFEMKKNSDSVYHKSVYVYLSGLPRDLIFSKPDIETDKSIINLSFSEKEWIKNHPRIRFGVDPEFAPFEYITSDGLFQGMTSEYIEILNKRLGLNMQLVKYNSWKEVIEKAINKELDVLPCVCITHSRKKYLNFSMPYINFHRAIITRSDIPFLTGIQDIENMKVAVQLNSSHEDYLLENTNIKPIIYPTLKKALLATSNGRVQAFIGNFTSSAYWIRKLNLINLKVAAPVTEDTQTLHFGIRDDWPELVNIINKGLSSLGQKEEDDIRKRWINIEYKPGIASELVWKYILQIAAISVLIVVIILFWNYRLKKEIKKRIEIDKKLFAANQSLKKIDQLKSMFIASMSHELRTPLNSIIGFTGVILMGMTGPLNEKQKDHLTRVNESAKHLLALITDVIDISKIEAGKIDIFPQDVNLAKLVDEAIITIQPQLQVKKLKLNVSVPDDLNLFTDRKRLLQCIINFLSNAVKYTEEGDVTIEAQKVDSKVNIMVSDTGIGIPPEDFPKLFNAFERLDSHLRIKAGGTGLGLYLIRKLATDILEGEIFFNSKKGKGSTFGLIIPIRISASDNSLTSKEDKS